MAIDLVFILITVIALSALGLQIRKHRSVPVPAATVTTALVTTGSPPVVDAEPMPPLAELIKVGGKLIDKNQWSPEVLDQVKKDYFLPPFDGHFMRVDFSAGCAGRHNTMVRIGLMDDDPFLADKLLNAMQKGKVQLACRTCGKPATIAARTVVWNGAFKNWDGAT